MDRAVWKAVIGGVPPQPRRAVRRLGAVALVVASCTSPAPGSIHGLLADCGGPAPGGVYPTSGTVWLVGNGMHRSGHTQTEGRFVFANLSPGSYTVYAGHGSNHYPEQSVMVKAGSTSTITLCFPIP